MHRSCTQRRPFSFVMHTPHSAQIREKTQSHSLRFVDSCLNAVTATVSGVRIRRNLWLCVYLYARGCVYTPLVYTHPPFAYTHRPAYTHPGAYMHPLRIRTHHSRKRTYLRIHTLGRVCAPTRVYAPTTAYKHICVYAASGA